jgi:hypothetical protein
MVAECLPVDIGGIVFILINVQTILQSQRCFLAIEEEYSYLFPIVENIFSDTNVKDDQQT